MHEPRHSQAAVWTCIGVLAASVAWAQAVLVIHRTVRADEPDAGRVGSSPDLRPVRGESVAGPLDAAVAEERVAEWFLEAIVQVESAGDPFCTGEAGERGLMQIRESTWREVTDQVFGAPVPFARAFEPELNRRIGQAYLANLCAFLRSNRSRWRADLRSLLAACYNVGPHRVLESGFDIRLLPRSTQGYVERVSTLHDYYLHDSGIAPSSLFVRRVDLADRDS